MKKLLVLMLVLGMGSLASAGYMLEGDGQPEAHLTADGQYAGFWFTTIGGTADIEMLYSRPGTSLEDWSDNADIAAYAETLLGAAPTGIWLVSFVDSTSDQGQAIKPNGVVTRFLGIDYPVTVTLHDKDNFGILQQVTLVPEPVSLMLLGLGGLFLRRRK